MAALRGSARPIQALGSATRRPFDRQCIELSWNE